MIKTLVLIRHAHRNADDRLKDNSLSERGEEQVKKLQKFFKARFEASKTVFFSSPKKRCIETISPLAKDLNEKLVNIDPRLDEHGSSENAALFMARMDEFLDVWKYEGAPLTVVCSHGDWIPVAVQRLTGQMISIKKAGWIEIEYTEGMTPALTWIVQKQY